MIPSSDIRDRFVYPYDKLIMYAGMVMLYSDWLLLEAKQLYPYNSQKRLIVHSKLQSCCKDYHDNNWRRGSNSGLNCLCIVTVLDSRLQSATYHFKRKRQKIVSTIATTERYASEVLRAIIRIKMKTKQKTMKEAFCLPVICQTHYCTNGCFDEIV